MAATSANKSDLWAFLNSLVDIEPHIPTENDPPWHEAGKLYETDASTYWHFLELLPPRWIHGDWFACGEGTGPFSLYVKVQGGHYVRELTDSETQTFCDLSGTPLYL
jgi:hypothetical protein